MTTTHRMHLVLWATFAALVGVLSMLLARGTSICLVGIGETTLAECLLRGEHLLRAVELTEQRARTNVAMVHEAGHPEPWIIALSQTPSAHRAFDYGLRWGIEALFSDFKTRGFDLETSQIERTDRLDRLVLVLALALHWAVSTGMCDAVENRTPAEKKVRGCHARMSPAA